MNKTILIIIGLVLAAVGAFLAISRKPIQVNIQLQPTASPASSPGQASAAPSVVVPLRPAKGSTLTIRNCQADPQILEVSEGTEITITNADSQAHTLSYFDFVTQGLATLELPAGVTLKSTKLSTPRNSTNNFSCDGTTLPYGGAVYVRP